MMAALALRTFKAPTSNISRHFQALLSYLLLKIMDPDFGFKLSQVWLKYLEFTTLLILWSVRQSQISS